MIYHVTGWFEIAQYDDKSIYLLKTWLKLRHCQDTLDQYKSRMTKDNNLLVTSSGNTAFKKNMV